MGHRHSTVASQTRLGHPGSGLGPFFALNGFLTAHQCRIWRQAAQMSVRQFSYANFPFQGRARHRACQNVS